MNNCIECTMNAFSNNQDVNCEKCLAEENKKLTDTLKNLKEYEDIFYDGNFMKSEFTQHAGEIKAMFKEINDALK